MIRLRVDTREIEQYLSSIGDGKQIPFAIAGAINNVARSVQSALREDMKAHMKLRRESFNLNSIRIITKASKISPYAEVSIGEKAKYMTRLVTGDDHVPYAGGKYIAIPNPEVFSNKVITSANQLYIRNLHLRPDPHGRGMVGDKSTYLSPTQPPLILQDITVGRGKKKAEKKRVLYVLVKRSKGVHKLDFYGIAMRIISGNLDSEMQSAIAYALRSARR